MSPGIRHRPLVLVVTLASLAIASASASEEPAEPTPAPEAQAGRRLLWSTTVFGAYKGVHSSYDNDGLGGFFDQYEFTPNKASGGSLELGIRDASFDWIEDDAPRIQFRYDSPTSNLGVSGADLDNAFQNQRALLLGRTEAFQLDVDYRRLRTEQLRIYPETQAGGAALPYTDLTGKNDRFYRERTGFQSELRWRPAETLAGESEAAGWLAPELAFRSGFDRRESRVQQRALLNPGNDWLALERRAGDDVVDVGAGVLVAPGGLFTAILDFDYQTYDADNAELDSGLPFASTGRSVGFVPSTERGTGEVSLHARFGDRAVVTAGFQATVLDQEDPKTPAQRAVGLGRNKAVVYSAQLSGDVRIARNVSANAYVKYVYRDHDLNNNTPIFNPGNGTQVDEILETYHRVDAGAEGIYRPLRGVKLAAGARILRIDRDLDFAPAGFGNPVILEENAWVDDETTMWTVYGRADWRPLPGLGIRTELSFRDAPDTGYVTDLDGYVEGRLNASYVVPVTRPTSVSFHVRGGRGENSDFSAVEGVGPDPPGPSRKRDYERSHWNVGLSGDMAVRRDLTLFSSLYFGQDEQTDKLLLSNLQRYFQDAVPLTFRKPGNVEFRTDELGLVFGSQYWLSERTDAGLSYSFTLAKSEYRDSGAVPELQLIGDNRVVDAEIHSIDLELRHQIREGMRVFGGYRLQVYSDGASKPNSPSSSRQPGDRTDTRHTVTFGITLNGELLARR